MSIRSVIMSYFRRVERKLQNGRAGYQRGVRVLVNGSMNASKPLAPHVAQHAAEKIDDYVEQLEKIITDLLRIEKSSEVVH